VSWALDAMWGISIFPCLEKKYFDKTQNIIFKLAELHVGLNGLLYSEDFISLNMRFPMYGWWTNKTGTLKI
jgi:hypothetical protein